ncbi:hypothetical protein [Chitinophaga barathri]|uniref:Suppressor of fused domain protein n=1 Tax=Chitinophaga barathri TaxID=1647451 RepID=A0A3N4MD38_9BACT|nr:hypothetical protein [Chitinophaga barathri]RPD39477.1 hypothetical protein EG028_20380 [Chitinophaga barathri]
MELLSKFEIEGLSPLHHGYPAWPGGGPWLHLYRSGASWTVLTSGLSDGNEYPYELFLDSADEIEPDDFGSSWQANLIYETGRIIPNVPGLKERLEENKFLTLQVHMDGAPDEWSLPHEDGNIGLFLTPDDSSVSALLPNGKALNVKLMRPEELVFCLENGMEGRLQLAGHYKAQGGALTSGMDRESVV